MSEQQVDKIREFNRFYANYLGKIDQDLYKGDYNLIEARIISHIFMKNECSSTDIRETLGVDRGYMSRTIQRLEENHLVIKNQSDIDKRQYTIKLTDKGIKTYNKLVGNSKAKVGEMISNLPTVQINSIVESMDNIQSSFSIRETNIHIRKTKSGDIGYIAHLHGRLYDETYKFGSMFEYYVLKGLVDLWITLKAVKFGLLK